MFKVVRVLLLGGLVGKVLGVARELLFAWLFGTGVVASAFRLAQSALLIPLQGFVSETVNGGFTPSYAAMRQSEPARASRLFTGIYSILLLVSCLVALVLVVTAHLWIKTLAPGFDAERANTATIMLQILAISLPAYVLSGLFASVDLAMGRGRLNASRASIQSLGLIVGTFAAYWLNMPTLIAAGFVIAYLILFLTGSRVVSMEGLSLKPTWRMTPEIRLELKNLFKIVRILIWIPIAFQINSVIERRVASEVNLDAMAALDYARFMTDTLIILIAMPFGVAGLSTMAAMSADEFRAAKLKAFRALLYVGIPLSAAMYANATLIVSIVFERGAFGARSVSTTADILAGMAIGIWGQLLGYTGAKFLTARGRNREALVASLAGVFLSILVLLTFNSQLNSKVLGLAASAQGLLFGVVALYLLRVIRSLQIEIVSLICIGCIYVIFIQQNLAGVGDNLVYLVTFTCLYWTALLLVLPWHRRTVISTYLLAIKRKPL